VAGRSRRDDRGPRRPGRPEIPWPRAKKPAPDRETIRSLQERAKELACLYRVDEALARPDATVEEAFAAIIAAIPPGWQYPAACQARIFWDGRIVASPGYVETEWRQTAALHRDHMEVGRIEVSYIAEMAEADEGPFLKEEARLIEAIAERISTYLTRTVRDNEAG
jgi:pyruvate,water dikinase